MSHGTSLSNEQFVNNVNNVCIQLRIITFFARSESRIEAISLDIAANTCMFIVLCGVVIAIIFVQLAFFSCIVH